VEHPSAGKDETLPRRILEDGGRLKDGVKIPVFMCTHNQGLRLREMDVAGSTVATFKLERVWSAWGLVNKGVLGR
jgi:hypothetical protein